jgi:hypothetical protein
LNWHRYTNKKNGMLYLSSHLAQQKDALRGGGTGLHEHEEREDRVASRRRQHRHPARHAANEETKEDGGADNEA